MGATGHSARPHTISRGHSTQVDEENRNLEKEHVMGDVVYVSKSRIERKQGPLRVAYLPGASQPVIFSVHGAIAEHYKVDPPTLYQSHAPTLDFVTSSIP